MMKNGVKHEKMLVETFYMRELRTRYSNKAHKLMKRAIPEIVDMERANGLTGKTSPKTDIILSGANDSGGPGYRAVRATLSVKMPGDVLLSSAGGKGTANILQKVYHSSKGKAPRANTLPYLLGSKVPQKLEEEKYAEWKADEGDSVIAQLHNWLDKHDLWVPFIVEMLSGKEQFRGNNLAFASHLFCAGYPDNARDGYCVPITNKLAKSMLKHIKVRLFKKGSASRGVRRPSIAIDLRDTWCPLA